MPMTLLWRRSTAPAGRSTTWAAAHTTSWRSGPSSARCWRGSSVIRSTSSTPIGAPAISVSSTPIRPRRRMSWAGSRGSIWKTSISCPHYGTNVSTFFTRPLGRALFRWVARYLAFMLERGRLPLKVVLRLGYLVVRVWDPRRRRRGTFDQVYERLLNDLSEE